MKRLMDDADILQANNEEANKLKEIAIKQVSKHMKQLSGANVIAFIGGRSSSQSASRA